jgi:class 3 adenylate cyclase/tetratricopeptide (TPR) repeat protein
MAEPLLCPSCRTPNAADQRFCGACGASLTRTCPTCGTINPLAFAFCGSCGTALSAEVRAPSPREERRIATVMFADLSGFTSLAERMDPEDVKALAHRLAERMGDVVRQFGGTVVNVMGDAVMAVFGAPLAHEDDAERAVRSALAMRDTITIEPQTGESLRLHIGVNTGEVMAGMVGPTDRHDYAVMGDVTNTAARLQTAARPGEILVGQATYRATAHAIDYEEIPPVHAKGKEEPVLTWRVLAARDRPAERPTALVPLVGRAAEFDLLDRLWKQVVTEGRPRLVTVIGPPGIGKSRLIREFAAKMGTTGRFLRGRCLPYGETTGYDAFGQHVQQAAGILETDPVDLARDKLHRRVEELVPGEDAHEVTTHLEVLLGLSAEGAPDKQPMYYSARRFLEGLATEQPTVLAFEDLHWAQPALLELIESVAGRARDVPLYVIALSRPELLDHRPSWGGGLLRYTAIPLEPLDELESKELAQALLTRGGREAGAIDSLIQTGGGNPLFLEELAASLAERVAGESSALPSTVQAIIASRLDALPAEERRVVQEASIMGRFFWRGALEALGSDGKRLDDALDGLEARDFIRRQPSSRLAGDREFIFKHILTQEVAYSALPKASRREGHAAVAAFLERVLGERSRESASMLAYHWREAGERDRAGRYLIQAAEVASRAWAKEQAIDLYTEVLDLLGDGGDAQLIEEALLGRAHSRLDGGDYTKAVEEDLQRLLPTVRGKNRSAVLLARTRAAFWLGDADGVHTFAAKTAEAAREVQEQGTEARALSILAEAAGMDGDLDRAMELQARAELLWPEDARDAQYAYSWTQLGVMHYWRGEYEEALNKAKLGFDLGLQVSSLYPTINGAAHVGLALTGLSRHEEAIEWFQRAVTMGREWEPLPRFTGRAMNMWAGALRELGDLAAARELNEQGLEMGQKAAFPGAHVSARVDLMVIDLLEGDVGKAEAALPELLEIAAGTKGWHQWLWTGRLAEAQSEIHLQSGRWQDAADAAMESLRQAEKHGRVKYAARSRIVLGRAQLALGKQDEAEGAFRQAVADAERLGHAPTLWQAQAELASGLERTGKESEAEEARVRARDVMERFAATLAEPRRELFLSTSEAATILGPTTG